MANSPARKRPVAASRTAAPRVQAARVRQPAANTASAAAPARAGAASARASGTASATGLASAAAPARAGAASARAAAPARATAPILDDDAPSENYALRLTEALEAISSAESGRPLKARAERPVSPPLASHEAESRPRTANFASSLKALDALPPIRLPIGPAIPWRLGLPLLAASVAVVAFMSRPSGHADAQGVRLPAQETYAVQQEAPLFTNSSQPSAPATGSGSAPATGSGSGSAPAAGSASAPAAGSGSAPAAGSASAIGAGLASASAPAQPALGVQDPGGLGFDAADIAFKLIAVLALAYGSLYLLKRFGVGGNAAAKSGGMAGMRVVSSLALAPNRSVHVLKVPGGKTLLVGATPNQVNLIADLGELASDEESPEATSFFNVLKSKINN